MAEILFYHLTRSTVEDALPQLLAKTLERGWRAVLQAVTEERVDTLDEHLWTFRDESFLPHAKAGGERDAMQPLLLTTGPENPNNAVVRFYVEGAVPSGALDGYVRCVVMFDGEDADQLTNARGAWKALKGEAHELTYWQQTPERRWKQMA